MAPNMGHMDLVAMRNDDTGQEHLFRPSHVALRLKRGWTVIDDSPTPSEPAFPEYVTGTEPQENTTDG